MTARLYPLDPLFEAMNLGPAAACRLLGVSGSTEQKYRRDGVTERTAERLALRAGFHPYTVWAQLLDDVLAEVEAADKTADAARKRRQYHANPGYRQSRIASAQAYRDADPEAKRRSDARYRSANRARLAAKQRERDRARAAARTTTPQPEETSA